MKPSIFMITMATVVAGASGVRADVTYKRDIPDSLAAQAKVTEAKAVATAIRAVPKGKVASIELEVENGRLIYSMDLKTAGRKGVDEVNVDAKTGKRVGRVRHESAAAEKAEDKAEAKAKGDSATKRP